jgi:hypothetical protein
MMPDPLQSHRFHAILVIARKGGNTMDEKMREDFPGRTEQVQTMKCDPLDLITTDQLETELWNAIMEDSSGSCNEGEVFEEIEDTLDDDDYEDEAEQRRSTLRLLSDMRPQLAELLGGPPAEHGVSWV